MDYCPKCGVKIENKDASFCINCGFALKTATVQDNIAPPPVQEKPVSAPERAVPQPFEKEKVAESTPSSVENLFDFEFSGADSSVAPVPANTVEQSGGTTILTRPSPSPVPMDFLPGKEPAKPEKAFSHEPKATPAAPSKMDRGAGIASKPMGKTQEKQAIPEPKLDIFSEPDLKIAFASDREEPLVPPKKVQPEHTQPESLFQEPVKTPFQEQPASLFEEQPKTKEPDLISPEGGVVFKAAEKTNLFEEAQVPVKEPVLTKPIPALPNLFAENDPAQPVDLFGGEAEIQENQTVGQNVLEPAAQNPSGNHQVLENLFAMEDQMNGAGGEVNSLEKTAEVPHAVSAQQPEENLHKVTLAESISRAVADPPVGNPPPKTAGAAPLATGNAPPIPPPVSRKAKAQQMPQNNEMAKPRKKGGGTIVKVLVGILLAISLLLVSLFGVLYFLNRPAKVISDFAKNITDKDYVYLEKNTHLEGVESTQEGWIALSAAFDDPSKITALKAELEADAKGVSQNRMYQAIEVQSDPFLFFIQRHTVVIHGVDLVVPDAGEGTVLRVGETNHDGTPTDNGVLYTGFMPGRYQAQVLLPGANTPSDSVQVEAFSLDLPTEVMVAGGGAVASSADITVMNSLNDEATIYINGEESPIKPIAGIVSLPDVALGSEIRIVGIQDGVEYEATVTFTDITLIDLTFENYVQIGGAASSAESGTAESMTPAEIDTVLGTFYQSYLNSINTQSLDGIQASTAKNNEGLTARIAKPGNKDNNFAFTSAKADPESIVVGEENGVPSITFNATFTYTFWPRNGASSAAKTASNHQTVQLLYQDGSWKVNKFVFVDDTAFAAHELAK